MGDEVAETARNGGRGLTRLADRVTRTGRGAAEPELRGAGGAGAVGMQAAGIGMAGAGVAGTGISGTGGSGMTGTGMPGAGGTSSGKRGSGGRLSRRDAAKATTAATAEATGQPDVDYLKRSLEQIAASREKNRAGGENWLKDLKPEEVQLIGDILKEYLA